MTTTNVQPDTANAGSAFAATTGSAVTFSQATATGTGPLTYAWNFGDGGTATGALNPTYTYKSAGTYNAQLTVTDALGIPAMSTVTVTVNNNSTSAPTVSAGSPYTVNAESSLTFSQATETGGTAPFAYAWSFGDGTTQSGSLNPSHTYPNPGSYTATVTVTDANKLTSSSSVAVTVNDVAPTVSFTDPPAVAGSPVSFTASATDVSPAVQAAGFTYSWNFGDGTTGTGASTTHTYTSAGTYTVSVTATDMYRSTSQPATKTMTVSNATQAGMTYYVSPSATSGSGTLANPFGLPDLLNADDSPGRALTVLKPGDTLDFEAGNYHFNGVTNNGSWATQLLGPTVSGTPTQPITLQALPGATVNIFEDSGSQPVFGTGTPALNYVRFLGFNVNPGGDAAFYIAGVGDEVAYNDVVGEYAATADNHDGIRIETANAAWIHNNIITGVTGESHNSAGIKVYQSTNLLITDNYIYGNTTGIFDKDSGTLGDGTNLNTYARNWITNNTGDQFLGNNQGDLATYYIYDNVINGGINLYTINTGSQIYNNLLFTTGVFSWEECYLSSIWNNIILTGSQPGSGYSTDESLSTGQSTSPVAYMDYNVYDNAPVYSFSGHYTLAQMQSYGFENHAYVSSDSSLFQNTTSYALLPQWTTAGRYGDPVGPRYPVAQIMNTSRYGPGALTTGTSPSITQQPQNQTVASGGSATFTTQASGSGLLYQWMTSTNAGSSWSVVQGATSATLTVPQVSSANSGTMYWCLVSSASGSAWSNPVTLTVSATTNAIIAPTPSTQASSSSAVGALLPSPVSGIGASSSSSSAISMGVLSSTPLNAGTSSINSAPGRAKAISATPRGPLALMYPTVSRANLPIAASDPSLERAAKPKSLLSPQPGKQSI